jgi:membrane protease YdiL (CAAX protease family)
MENLLIFLPFLVPVIVANYSERQRLAPHAAGDERTGRSLDLVLRYAPYALLILINLGLLGFAGIALLNQLATMLMPEQMEQTGPQVFSGNWWAVALISLLTALLAFLPLIPMVRRWLVRILPIDPDSLVHMTALCFAIYQIGISLGQMALIGSLENLTNAELSLTIADVLFSGLPLILFALVGVGLLIRRDGSLSWRRLGLKWPTWKQLLIAVGITASLLAFDYGVTLLWERLDPAGYDLLDRVTENIFGNLMTVGGALALGLSAGISEELLFRGAVQPRLGLLFATFLFTIGHLQYGLTIATLEIFIIGLVLGLVRNGMSTTICIVIHAAYNSTGVLLGLLQP